MRRETHVVVFGSSRVQEGTADHALARAVGALIGRRGLILVSGGYGGSMGAASRGSREVGGRVLGITTPIFREREPNEHLTEHRVEPDYPARMAAMLRLGDAFVALPGALGTLSEWLTAWCLASIDQLGGPLWVFEEPWRAVHTAIVGLPELAATQNDHLRWVRDAPALEADLDKWIAGGHSG